MGQHQGDKYLHYKGLRRRRKRKTGADKLLENIMVEHFLNLMNETDVKFQKPTDFQKR